MPPKGYASCQEMTTLRQMTCFRGPESCYTGKRHLPSVRLPRRLHTYVTITRMSYAMSGVLPFSLLAELGIRTDSLWVIRCRPETLLLISPQGYNLGKRYFNWDLQ